MCLFHGMYHYIAAHTDINVVIYLTIIYGDIGSYDWFVNVLMICLFLQMSSA